MTPRQLPRPCSHPGCPALVTEGSRCPEHKKDQRRWENQNRKTFRERGYSTAWDRLKEIKKRRDPLCELCLKEGGRVVPVEIVHHIIPVEEGGPMLDMDNLMSVCRSCHGKLHSK